MKSINLDMRYPLPVSHHLLGATNIIQSSGFMRDVMLAKPRRVREHIEDLLSL